MWIRESFLEFNSCYNRLKLVLVTCKQFCSLKRCGVCYKMDFNNNSHVVTCLRVAREFRLCLVWRCVENDYAVQKHFWKHKLFIVIVFYKNIFCFEGAPSSYRVANLIALNYCLDEIEHFFLFEHKSNCDRKELSKRNNWNYPFEQVLYIFLNDWP